MIKEIMFQKFLLKMILKKVYNLSDRQYERVVKAFELESEEEAKKYLDGVGSREELKKWLKDYEEGNISE